MATGYWGTTTLPGQIRMHHREFVVTWETIAPHPAVMAHPTAEHQTINFLQPHNGVMLIGYGDWTENTGPVDVIGYDLETREPVTLLAGVPSEAFDRVRIIDGRAYLPWADPRVGNQGGFTTDRTGVWENVLVGPGDSMIHTLDLMRIGGKIHLAGSRTGSGPGVGVGVVWREDSPGNWTEVLRGANEQPLARFYSFKPMGGGKVRVQNWQGGVETYETDNGGPWYPVYDTVWSSTPTWGSASTDPPPALPAGYGATHGIGTVTAAAYHDGWVWIGGAGGVVKRALVPTE